VASIVLAAGRSTRLGVPKQLIEFRGEPLVRRAAMAAANAGASKVLVVVGAEISGIAQALNGLSFATIVVNERWQHGLASSLAAGVRGVQRREPRAEGVLITTVDQPLVSDAALAELFDAFNQGARVVAAAYSGTTGVPAVIAREHFRELLELHGDVGAGRWLRAKRHAVQRITMPEAAVDLDTAEDVALLGDIAKTGSADWSKQTGDPAGGGEVRPTSNCPAR
jgi:molybdenum cofactor cytidylyltransferase